MREFLLSFHFGALHLIWKHVRVFRGQRKNKKRFVVLRLPSHKKRAFVAYSLLILCVDVDEEEEAEHEEEFEVFAFIYSSMLLVLLAFSCCIIFFTHLICLLAPSLHTRTIFLVFNFCGFWNFASLSRRNEETRDGCENKHKTKAASCT